MMDEDLRLENPSQPENPTGEEKQPVTPAQDTGSDQQPTQGESPQEKQTVPEGQPEGQPAEGEGESGQDDTPLSPRQQKRIQQLVNKITGQAKEATEPQAKQEPQAAQQPNVEQIVQQQLAVRDFQNQYRQDLSSVDKEYDILTKNKELRGHVDALYEAVVGYNPNTKTVQRVDIGYKEFVDAYMDGAKSLSEFQTSEATNAISEQYGNSAINSTAGVNSTSQITRESIAKMSNEEYERRRPEIERWLQNR